MTATVKKTQKKRMSQEQRRIRRQKIAEFLTRNGNSTKKACRHFGVTRSVVIQARKEHNVPATPLSAARTPIGGLTILAALLNDPTESLTSIAGRLGVATQQVSEVYRKARAAGIRVSTRRRGRPAVGSMAAILPLTSAA